MRAAPVYILGGYQTDFAINYARQNRGIVDIIVDTVRGALTDTKIAPEIGRASCRERV